MQNNWPFIYEQSESLKKLGIEMDLFLIKGKGILGYLKNLKPLRNLVKLNSYDLIHAHYGLSGMLAVMQRLSPVIISIIGSDIYRRRDRIFSKIAIRLSAHNIFVEKKLSERAKAKNNYSIISYGVDTDIFTPLDKNECRKQMNLDIESRIALFPSSFNRPEKNYLLAKKAVELVGGMKIIQMGGDYTREEVNKLFNACDLVLMTSLTEGSPMVIKEAMACNCSIVSTDVGDVKEIIGNTRGCYISSFDPEDVADKIKKAIDFGRRTDGREKIKRFEINTIARQIKSIYEQVINDLI